MVRNCLVKICMEEIVFKICYKDFIVLQISTEANQESSVYCRLHFRILFLVDFYPIICNDLVILLLYVASDCVMFHHFYIYFFVSVYIYFR